MIKSELRSLIINILPRFQEKEAFHQRFIDATLEKALAEFYNLVFLRDPLELQRYTYGLGYTVPLPIVLEATTGLYYSNYSIGYSIIPFPDKASGVRRVSTPIQSGASFYPMDNREMDLILSGSYTDTVTAKFGYVPTRTRIEFYNLSPGVIASGVRADVIIPFSNYADDEVVLTPELTSDEGRGLVDRVVELLARVPPVELLENKQLQETKE